MKLVPNEDLQYHSHKWCKGQILTAKPKLEKGKEAPREAEASCGVRDDLVVLK